MSGIWISRIELVSTTGELVGYKSGLALTRDKLSDFVPSDCAELWHGKDDIVIRIRPEEFEHIIATILYRVGNIPSPLSPHFGIRLFHKYRNDTVRFSILTDTLRLFPGFIQKGIRQAQVQSTKKINPTPFIEKIEKLHGHEGAFIAIELLRDMDLCMHRSPWAQYRRVEWVDAAQLKDLFNSESLDTLYGNFIDQRFIDYLNQNFEDIDRINWRKFEALTCEFFEKNGFYVQIGRGRDDGGIDARVWPREEYKLHAPTILIQCKRQKKKISKVIVKSLWADIIAEKADSGLIVTTSALSQGAKKVCTARGYPITQTNRETLREWIKSMRSPNTGVFLGE